jgi:hypothetical protein
VVALDKLEPEEHNRVYKMLNLTVVAHANEHLEVKWPLGGDPCSDNATTARCSSAVTTPVFKFRALLTSEGTELELARI